MNNLNIKDPVCGMNVSETSKFSTTNDKKEYNGLICQDTFS